MCSPIKLTRPGARKTVALAPTDINTGKALIYPAQAGAIMDLVKKGVR